MIEINNLSKRYRNKQIFNHLTMSFDSNRLTVLLVIMVLENQHYFV